MDRNANYQAARARVSTNHSASTSHNAQSQGTHNSGTQQRSNDGQGKGIAMKRWLQEDPYDEPWNAVSRDGTREQGGR
ncbi:hypothetical protein ABVK25_010490 [Lepraria finkii]|uniref:Uncharacterized protein n=1 Tax=Lepraria finkii TaxID=1340010 RepID=A0ABR4B0E7_9LECA